MISLRSNSPNHNNQMILAFTHYSLLGDTLQYSEAMLNDVCAYGGDVLTHVQQSTIMTATQPPRLFTMRNLGGFLLPHYHNKHKGQ